MLVPPCGTSQFYCDMVVAILLASHAEDHGFDPQPEKNVIRFFSPVTALLV